MYGTQTQMAAIRPCTGFENDVKMYGTQTFSVFFPAFCKFENDVKMYGTQTIKGQTRGDIRLRMM